MANIVSTGGWALVFAVEDVATGKEYALKVRKLLQTFLFASTSDFFSLSGMFWNILFIKLSLCVVETYCCR